VHQPIRIQIARLEPVDFLDDPLEFTFGAVEVVILRVVVGVAHHQELESILSRPALAIFRFRVCPQATCNRCGCGWKDGDRGGLAE
jgi:hypothetical protein